MDDIVELDNIKNVCRLCLSTDEPKIDIFGIKESSLPFDELIHQHLLIEVASDDKLSTLICEGCIDKVKDWHIYKESCKKSQEKLQQWLVKNISNNSLNMDPSVKDDTNVKSPAELSQADVSVEDIIPEEISSIENDSTLNTTMDDVSMESIEEDSPVKNEELKTQKNTKADKIEIKREPHDDYDNIDVESVADSELLINPMAGVTNKIIEPDSTQKFTKSKKKIRRGLRTHFRGVRAFKKKCSHCQVILHSKFSYKNHMQRYHNDDNNLIENSDNNTKEIETGNSTEDDEYYDGEKQQEQQQQQSNEDDEVMDDEESIEDVEDELISMEKNAPLTQVQENIISQLKTFSCYSCQQVFNDRRSTLNHIRQHMPDLRPYTCIACLTEFPDRSIYKLHCGASFECAMKIALVTPKHGTEKYFTCNMCLRPMPNRKDLLTHLSKHSDRQYEQLTAPQKTPIKLKSTTTTTTTTNIEKTTPMNNSSNKKTNNKLINPSLLLGPYQNGAPSHNHTCIYCGMIYKHKPNMLKHRELCQRLPPHERNSYHCAHCGLTFLIFKKFQSHTNTEHRRKEIICYLCGSKYKHAHEFLAHYQEHRDSKNDNKNNKIIKYGCPLCPKEFTTQNQLQQHKTSHLKLKNTDKPLTIDDDLKLIGDCSMQQEQQEQPQQQDTPIFSPPSGEPGSRSTECRSCGKIFANYPNLRRHVRTAHIINGRFCCPNCTKTFTSEDLWIQHGQRAHPRDIEASTILITCQQCKKVFNDAEQHSQHLIEEHGIDEDDHLACDICGKRFSNETSLKIHRGHHFRRDSRLSIRNIPNPMEQVQVEIVEGTNELNLSPIKIDKLTSPSSIRSSSPSKVKKNLMLDSFNDLSNDDNNDDEDENEGDDDGNNIDDDGGDDVDDDEANNDDIDNSKSLQCTVCNNNFNDIQDLRKHLVDVHCTENKIDDSFNEELQCNLCTNIFNDEQSLDEHMKWHKEDSLLNDVVRAPPDIMCDICGKYYSSIKSLTKHKKLHKTNSANIKFTSVKKPPITASFPCPICKKVFNNENSMKKHKAGAHYARRTIASIAAAAAAAAAASTSTTSPSIPLSVATPSPRKSSTKSDDSEIRPKRPKLDFDIIRKAYNLGEPSGSSVGTPNTSKKPVTCGICKKLFPTKSSLYKHRSNVHKITSKSPAKNKTTDDNNDDNGGGASGSVADDDDGVQCSDCFKIFSNSSNMRQHYTKVHGNGEKHYCTIDDCNEEFDTSVAKQLHEKSHMSMLFQCNYCDKNMFNRGAIDSHLLTDHSSNVNDDNLNDEKKHFKKVDLDDYEVKGADGRVCPVCLIKYPNIKALKIHYVKIHEGNT
ncbi:hypothetical protein HCN44_007097 [Aphidius gifuensis]|uniref:Uncharacterized protein n=1 Tax=Aphidius gifuensis TaxID=684658 RepID=A0A835CM06_APHGI|nr:zinc finger protein Xfin-like [Aphidius gifuensis]KAF7988787.1 hypothetical protein HCN44_007097 [Aphidius gifuensis]